MTSNRLGSPLPRPSFHAGRGLTDFSLTERPGPARAHRRLAQGDGHVVLWHSPFQRRRLRPRSWWRTPLGGSDARARSVSTPAITCRWPASRLARAPGSSTFPRTSTPRRPAVRPPASCGCLRAARAMVRRAASWRAAPGAGSLRREHRHGQADRGNPHDARLGRCEESSSLPPNRSPIRTACR